MMEIILRFASVLISLPRKKRLKIFNLLSEDADHEEQKHHFC